MLHSEKTVIVGLRCVEGLEREDFVFIEGLVRRFHESKPLTKEESERLEGLAEKYYDQFDALEEYDLAKMRSQWEMP